MNHYFAYKNPADASEGYVEITGADFYRLVRGNNLLPREERRVFARYDARDEQDNSVMYWETTREGEKRWRRSDYAFETHSGSLYEDDNLSSLDDMTDDEFSGHGKYPLSGRQAEKVVESNAFVEQLFRSLDGQELWTDMLAMYLNGQKRECASTLARKYGKCDKTMRNRQKELNELLKKFVADWA